VVDVVVTVSVAVVVTVTVTVVVTVTVTVRSVDLLDVVDNLATVVLLLPALLLIE